MRRSTFGPCPGHLLPFSNSFELNPWNRHSLNVLLRVNPKIDMRNVGGDQEMSEIGGDSVSRACGIPHVFYS
jgi:hypothetical protein